MRVEGGDRAWASTALPRNILYCLGKPPPPAAATGRDDDDGGAGPRWGRRDVSVTSVIGVTHVHGVCRDVGRHNEALHLPKFCAKWSKPHRISESRLESQGFSLNSPDPRTIDKIDMHKE
jgi:hypothetical protein